MTVLKKVVYCFLLNFIIISTSFGQEQDRQELIQGKNYFWQAKFDSAFIVLKEATQMISLGRDALFEAYLYFGFVLSRQKAPEEEIRLAFQQAIKLDPKRLVDELVIPPDLAELFDSERAKLVGCVFVTSDPIGAEVWVVEDETIVTSGITPTIICDIFPDEYYILFNKAGYQEGIMNIKMAPGKEDTLFVKLIPRIVSKTHGSKWWAWVTGGGALATAAAVLFKTVIQNGNNRNKVEDLPGPPDRPNPTP